MESWVAPNIEENAEKLATVLFGTIFEDNFYLHDVNIDDTISLEFASSVKFLFKRIFDYLLSPAENGQILNLEEFFFQDNFADPHWANIWRNRGKKDSNLNVSPSSFRFRFQTH
jgi:hypothetical protein